MSQTVVTDYTSEIDTFQSGIFQQYRLKKYFRDVLLNWIAQPENILDKRIRKMLLTQSGDLKPNVLKIGTAFDKDSKYAGTTPAIVISGGAIQYAPREVTLGPANGVTGVPQTAYGHSRRKAISITFTVITQDYDQTDLLSELLQLFLLQNANSIVKDCPMLSSFDVLKLDAPSAVETSMQSKQVYSCSIATIATGYVCWTEDTQGPVFKGLIHKANFK